MKKILLCSLFFCYLNFLCAQSGALDPSFGTNGIVITDMGSPSSDYNSFARQVLVKPDGSIYILLNEAYITKRLPNGSIDSAYGFAGYSRSISLSDANAALQPDGKIVMVGSDDNNSFVVARINTRGLPDSSFGNNGIQITEFNGRSFARAVAVQSDGKIVVAGYTIDDDYKSYFAVARYNTDGSPDNTFDGNGKKITTFGEIMQSANSVAVQADGKIVVSGYVYAEETGYDFAMARYKINGNLDSTFGNDGMLTTNFGSSNDISYSLALQADGKIVLAGYTSLRTNNNFAVARYTVNGRLDDSFNGNGKQTADLGSDMILGNSVSIQSNGKIVVAGYTLHGNDNDFAIARFNTNGSPDNTFDDDGILTTDFTSSDDYAGSIAIQNDDKIVVAGYSYIYSPGVNMQQLAVSRYNPDGSPDISFADNGKLKGDYKQGYTSFNTTAIQNDGKIITAGLTWNGSDYDFAIARYNTNGSLDNTFSNDGKQITDFGGTDEAISVVTQTDGKIIVAGNSNTQFAVARYNKDGSLDNSFSENGKLMISMGFSDVFRAVSLQSDGKIVAVGYTFTDPNYDSAFFALARFNSDGTPDNTFSGDGKQLTNFESSPSFAAAVAIQNDGKIVVAGRAYLDNRNNFSLARYNNDGSLDNTFSQDGKQNNVFGFGDYSGQSLAIQNDGKIIVAGNSETFFGNNTAFAVARYLNNGDLDNTFGNDGFQSTSLGSHFNIERALAIISDGRIAIGGTNDNYAIVLYKNDGSRDSTFGNDGIQTSYIGVGGSSIQSLAFMDNKLYAAGTGQFPGTLGVVARYLLGEGGPLPVSLVDFKAHPQNKSVLLQWQTASEQNLSGFIIQRSIDGNNFSLIGYVAATGNSNLKINYSTIDQHPLEGVSFYRLKMVDKDGRFTYSKIVSVNFSDKTFTFQVFPNPAKNILFVSTKDENESATFQIIDAGGRKLKEVKVSLIGSTSFPIYIHSLPKGIYNLRLITKTSMQTSKFMKE